jgi:hypothetical protein
VGFVVDKVALGQGFPEYFSLPQSISFHRCSITRKMTVIIIRRRRRRKEEEASSCGRTRIVEDRGVSAVTAYMKCSLPPRVARFQT